MSSDSGSGVRRRKGRGSTARVYAMTSADGHGEVGAGALPLPPRTDAIDKCTSFKIGEETVNFKEYMPFVERAAVDVMFFSWPLYLVQGSHVMRMRPDTKRGVIADIVRASALASDVSRKVLDSRVPQKDQRENGGKTKRFSDWETALDACMNVKRGSALVSMIENIVSVLLAASSGELEHTVMTNMKDELGEDSVVPEFWHRYRVEVRRAQGTRRVLEEAWSRSQDCMTRPSLGHGLFSVQSRDDGVHTRFECKLGMPASASGPFASLSAAVLKPNHSVAHGVRKLFSTFDENLSGSISVVELQDILYCALRHRLPQQFDIDAVETAETKEDTDKPTRVEANSTNEENEAEEGGEEEDEEVRVEDEEANHGDHHTLRVDDQHSHLTSLVSPRETHAIQTDSTHGSFSVTVPTKEVEAAELEFFLDPIVDQLDAVAALLMHRANLLVENVPAHGTNDDNQEARMGHRDLDVVEFQLLLAQQTGPFRPNWQALASTHAHGRTPFPQHPMREQVIHECLRHLKSMAVEVAASGDGVDDEDDDEFSLLSAASTMVGILFWPFSLLWVYIDTQALGPGDVQLWLAILAFLVVGLPIWAVLIFSWALFLMGMAKQASATEAWMPVILLFIWSFLGTQLRRLYEQAQGRGTRRMDKDHRRELVQLAVMRRMRVHIDDHEFPHIENAQDLFDHMVLAIKSNRSKELELHDASSRWLVLGMVVAFVASVAFALVPALVRLNDPTQAFLGDGLPDMIIVLTNMALTPLLMAAAVLVLRRSQPVLWEMRSEYGMLDTMTHHDKMRKLLEKVENPNEKRIKLAVPFLDLVDSHGPDNLMAWMHSRNNIRESKRARMKDLEQTLIIIMLLVLLTLAYKLLEVFLFQTGILSFDGASIQSTVLLVFYAFNLFEVVFIGATVNQMEQAHVSQMESITFSVEELIHTDTYGLRDDEKQKMAQTRHLLEAIADKLRHQRPIQVLGLKLTPALLSTLVSGFLSASGALLSSLNTTTAS